MKCAFGLIVGSSAVTLQVRNQSKFGPHHCVSVTQSQSGTCVLETRCKDQDISNVEFSFVCKSEGENGEKLQKHNFGVGGFDEEEEFDTGIQCETCSLTRDHAEVAEKKQEKSDYPAPKLVAQSKKQEAVEEKKEEKKEEEKKEATQVAPLMDQVAAQTTKFGPGMCVQTYKRGGTCWLETKCGDVPEKEFLGYNIGFICVPPSEVQPKCDSRHTEAECEKASWLKEKVTQGECEWKVDPDWKAEVEGEEPAYKCFGAASQLHEQWGFEPIRHFFGKGSFGIAEAFNTQIECEQCDGLDQFSEDQKMEEDVMDLKAGFQQALHEESQMMDNMKKVVDDVAFLKKEVAELKAAGATAAVEGGGATAAVAESSVQEETESLPNMSIVSTKDKKKVTNKSTAKNKSRGPKMFAMIKKHHGKNKHVVEVSKEDLEDQEDEEDQDAEQDNDEQSEEQEDDE